MLQEEFIPVALDQWYERRQQDAKGEFYRKIAAQGPRNDFEQTTQGHYVCDATGKLFGFNGNHCLLYTSPSPRDATLSRMPSSA